ncbi:glycine betaine ABC transporter substrate-binding protein [Proteinivorax hydrogeniformans]|uniref:Glycine betaine ABC transporter substrate-binding protein n=1 Tax=Proteinivorax hydrogeniformans TaxID=1826727 RepID=A0AAU8HTW9_9FIRM
MFKKKGFVLCLVIVSIFALVAVGCANGEAEVPGETTDESVVDKFDGEITGIDSGAGVMGAAEDAIAEYGLDMELVESSDAAMTASLQRAYENEEYIVVTGWAPHWKFADFNLKFLEDPKGVFGGEETINTITRQDFADEHPEVNQFLENYFLGAEDLAGAIGMMEEIDDRDEAAQAWIEENRELVDSWTEGIEVSEAGELSVTYVEWACATASTYVVRNILQDEFGYDVEVDALQAGAMWQGVASGAADFLLAAWLPGTHESYYADYSDDIVDLGPNYEGAAIGLVVPEYVDVDSIEELVE